MIDPIKEIAFVTAKEFPSPRRRDLNEILADARKIEEYLRELPQSAETEDSPSI